MDRQIDRQTDKQCLFTHIARFAKLIRNNLSFTPNNALDDPATDDFVPKAMNSQGILMGAGDGFEGALLDS
jgi:hypothetical protein